MPDAPRGPAPDQHTSPGLIELTVGVADDGGLVGVAALRVPLAVLHTEALALEGHRRPSGTAPA